MEDLEIVIKTAVDQVDKFDQGIADANYRNATQRRIRLALCALDETEPSLDHLGESAAWTTAELLAIKARADELLRLAEKDVALDKMPIPSPRPDPAEMQAIAETVKP